MDNSQIVDEKIARVTDILEQVEGLNKMIELHKSDLGSSSMLAQYQYMRKEFIQELNTLLQEYQLNVQAA